MRRRPIVRHSQLYAVASAICLDEANATALVVGDEREFKEISAPIPQTKISAPDLERFHWRDMLPAVALLIVSSIGTVAVVVSRSNEGGQYAVVAPPWYGQARAVGLVGKAGGEIIDLGHWTNIVVAHSKKPGFVRALYRAGAWLVFDPGRLRGCLGFERISASRTGGA